jgi:hypothetical protein
MDVSPFVMPGRDPGMHQKSASRTRMDCRVKRGNDNGWVSANDSGTISASLERDGAAEFA